MFTLSIIFFLNFLCSEAEDTTATSGTRLGLCLVRELSGLRHGTSEMLEAESLISPRLCVSAWTGTGHERKGVRLRETLDNDGASISVLSF